MPFDFKKYYDANKDYYGDAPLEEVAQDAFADLDDGKSTYDDWKKQNGIQPLVDEDNYQRKVQQARQDTPGLLGELGRSIGRGITQTVPEQVGKGLQWLDPNGGNEIVSDVGKSIEQFGTDNKKRFPGLTMSQEAENSPWYSPRFAAANAGESLVQSVVPMAVGAGVGMVGGGIAGAAAGLGALGGMFYGGTAEDTYREGIKKGLSDKDATDLANITGGIEAGGELIADLIPIGKFIGLGGKAAKNGIIKSLTSQKPIKEIGKDILHVIAGEELTESAQQAAQTYAAQRYGTSDQGVIDSVKEVWGPTLVTSLMFGMGGVGYDAVHRKNVRNALTNPDVDPQVRLDAINEVTSAANEYDPKVAKGFYEKAVDLWKQAKPITINDDEFYTFKPETQQQSEQQQTQPRPQPQQPSGPITAALNKVMPSPTPEDILLNTVPVNPNGIPVRTTPRTDSEFIQSENMRYGVPDMEQPMNQDQQQQFIGGMPEWLNQVRSAQDVLSEDDRMQKANQENRGLRGLPEIKVPKQEQKQAEQQSPYSNGSILTDGERTGKVYALPDGSYRVGVEQPDKSMKIETFKNLDELKNKWYSESEVMNNEERETETETLLNNGEVAPVEETKPVEKQPWEMTRDEFSKNVYDGGYDTTKHFEQNESGNRKLQDIVKIYNETTDEQNKKIVKESIDRAIDHAHHMEVYNALKRGDFSKDQFEEYKKSKETKPVKQPWQQTVEEFIGDKKDVDDIAISKSAHANHVREAVGRGEDVPVNVLEQYKNNGWAQTAIEKKQGNDVTYITGTTKTEQPVTKEPYRMTQEEFEENTANGDDLIGWYNSKEKETADELIIKAQVYQNSGIKNSKEKSGYLINEANAIAQKYFENNNHKKQVDNALESGNLTPQEAEQLGHFDTYPDLKEKFGTQTQQPSESAATTPPNAPETPQTGEGIQGQGVKTEEGAFWTNATPEQRKELLSKSGLKETMVKIPWKNLKDEFKTKLTDANQKQQDEPKDDDSKYGEISVSETKGINKTYGKFQAFIRNNNPEVGGRLAVDAIDDTKEKAIKKAKRNYDEKIKERSEYNERHNGITGKTIEDEVSTMSADEMSALFDEVTNENPDTTTEQPKEKSEPTTTRTTGTGGSKRTQQPKQPKQTKQLSDIVKEAGNFGVKGVEESFKGLYELFGGSTLKSFPAGFDEDSYLKAKPHFQAAYTNFIQAGKSLKEFFKFLVDNFGKGIKPYVMRFMGDMKNNTDETVTDLTEGKTKGKKQVDVGEKMEGKISAKDHSGRIKAIKLKLDEDFSDKNPEAVYRAIKSMTTKANIFTINPGDGATPGVRRVLEQIRSKFIGFEKYHERHHGKLKTNIEYDPDIVKRDVSEYIGTLEFIRDTLSGLTSVESIKHAFDLYLYEDKNVFEQILNMTPESSVSEIFGMADKHDNWFDRYIESQHEETKDLPIKRARVRLEDLNMPGERRNGKDIKATQLIDDFGIRGVEFGEWVDSVHGQLSVNYAYDAFHDLIETIGAPAKGISLNEITRLGLAFGSRGHSSAAAHFEPGNKVINLTKTNGDGSLAHEWGHAFDYMAGGLLSVENKAGYMRDVVSDIKDALVYTYNLDNLAKDVEAFLRNGQSMGRKIKPKDRVEAAKKLLEGWVGKYQVKTDFYKNALELDGNENGKYWSKTEEMFARSFESFVADKLQGKNPYLVNKEFVAPGAVEALFNRKNGAYPAENERQRFNEIFQHLFDGLEWNENGVPSIKKDYELVTEKEKRILNETVEELKTKLQDIFDAMFSGEQSADGLYWYAYKDTQRGVRMQPDGYMGYNDEFDPKSIEGGENHIGTGAVGYGNKLQSSDVLDYGLVPINHEKTDKTIYIEVEDETGRMGADSEAALGESSTGDGEVSQENGNIRGNTERGGRDGGGGIRGTGFGTGRKPGIDEGYGNEEMDIHSFGGGTEDTNGLAVSSTKLDYVLTSEDIPSNVSANQHYLNALSAIRLLKQIESENRLATTEEQAVLAKMPGWGTLAEALDYYPKDAWESRAETLKYELTDRELNSARDATLTSYFTPIEALNFIYSSVQKMGFNGGRILEPSNGLGHFIGSMPTDIRGKSIITAVEMDNFLVRFAKQLYQNSAILNSKYEDVNLPSDFFDFVASNVPFANYAPTDKEHNPMGLLLHDYFIVKSLNLLRPGGVGVFLTSSGTMDKYDKTARQEMSRVADLVGAVRLPSSAFDNTQSSVTTDILFFRKKSPDAPKVEPAKFSNVVEKEFEHESKWGGKTKIPLNINEYFNDHPEMILGELSTRSGRYGDRVELSVSGKITDLAEKFNDVLNKIPENIYREQGQITSNDILDVLSKPSDIKNGAYYIGADGSVYKNDGGTPILQEVKTLKGGTASESDARKVEVLKHFIGLRGSIREVLREMANETKPGKIKELQGKLEKQYDDFVDKFGFLNLKQNVKSFRSDPDVGMVLGLEKWDADTETATKREIFTQNLIERSVPPSRVETSYDALTVSLNYKNRIDLKDMSELSGKSQDEILNDLAGDIFNDPVSGWVTADDYLSGNVREKLKIAEQAAKGDAKYSANVEALNAVIPENIPHDKIVVQPGAAWIDPTYYEDFTNWILGQYNVPGLVISRNILGIWDISFTGNRSRRTGEESKTDAKNKKRQAYSLYEAQTRWGLGTEKGNYFELLNHLLNGTAPVIKDEEGRTLREPTTAAIMKMYEIKEQLNDWIWRDRTRRDDLTQKFNETMNSIVRRKHDQSDLPLPGKVPNSIITLSGHQNAVIRRYLKEGTAYFAHDVGTGKTFSMIASIMESKRLGLAKRPVMLVLKSTLTQIQEQFYRLYPGANILTINVPDKADARIREIQKIQAGNFDCIIMTHESFQKIPVSRDVEVNYLDEERRRLVIALNAMQEGRTSRRLVKQVSKRIQSLEAKIEELNDAKYARDPIPTFDEMGIDMIVADEAHVYKNLPVETIKTNVVGLNIEGSNIAFDMHLKSSYLLSTYGRGLIFASGSPVTNSVSELYSISRYLQPRALQARGIESFDAWANTFGDIGQATAYSPEGGGFRTVTKFRSFVNLPELMQMVGQVMDIVKFEDTGMKRPPIKGGKPTAVVVPLTGIAEQIANEVKERAVAYRNNPKEVEPDNILKIINDGRSAAMDPRLFNSELPDIPNTKTNYAVPIILENYKALHDATDENGKDYKENKGVQLIFADRGTPNKQKDFNVYDDLKQKLIAGGIPAKEIAFIHDATTDEAKRDVLKKVQKGDIRVIIGSTKKLGTGVNVQDRVVAMHNLDTNWTYESIEQRNGRGLRYGNRIKEVAIYNYGVEKTVDAFMWDTVASKGKVIGQILVNDPVARSVEDISLDEKTMSSDDMVAAFSNDPLVKEKKELEEKINRFRSARASYERQRAETQKNLAMAPSKLQASKENLTRMEGYRKDLEPIDAIKFSNKEDIFVLKKDGGKANEFADKISKNKSVLDNATSNTVLNVGSFGVSSVEERKVVVTDKKGNESEKIEKITNFDPKDTRLLIRFDKKDSFGPDTPNNLTPVLVVRSGNKNPVQYTIDMGGGISRCLTSLKDSIETAINDAKEKIAKIEKEIPEMKADLEKPFRYTQEMAASEARHSIVVQELIDQQIRNEAEIARRNQENRNNNQEEREIDFNDIDGSILPPAKSGDGRPNAKKIEVRFKRVLEKARATGLTLNVIDEVTYIKEEGTRNSIVNHQTKNNKRVRGFVERKANTLYIIAGNIQTMEEAAQVIAHELVGHYGLYEFMGEDLNGFLDELYGNTNHQQAIIDNAKKRGIKTDTIDGQRKAVKEYFAELIEKGKVEPSLWRRFVAAFKAALKSWGFNVELSVPEIEDIVRGAMKQYGDLKGVMGGAMVAATDKTSRRFGDVGYAGIDFQDVWHGTPHVWPPEHGFPHGRPRLDKIGEGEGGAAYGWGWYSAESHGVANFYKDSLSVSNRTWYDNIMENNRESVNDWLKDLLDENNNPSAKEIKQVAIDGADDALSSAESRGEIKFAERLLKTVKGLDENKFSIVKNEIYYDGKPYFDTFDKGGSIYKLDIPDEVIPKLLDWDKPISEQKNILPKIKEAFKKRGFDDWQIGSMIDRDITGEQAYTYLSGISGSKVGSETLASVGIPGNKYLDAMSRDNGKGTYNYVIWDQDVLDKIALLERNGEKLDAIREAETDFSDKNIPQTQTPEFLKWFGDSKVVDENGKPLVVKHWTDTDFNIFDKSLLGAITENNTSDKNSIKMAKAGFWFTTEDISNQTGMDTAMPVYLAIKNPKIWKGDFWNLGKNINKIKADGHDGIIVKDKEFGGMSYVAFNPNQIKSAIGNRGTFDPNDDRIDFSDSPIDLNTDENDLPETVKRWIDKKKDITWLDRLISLPMYHFKKIPQLHKAYLAASQYVKDKFSNQRQLLYTPDGKSLTAIQQEFKKKNPEEYERLNKYMIHQDDMRIGYKVEKDDKTGKYSIKSPGSGWGSTDDTFDKRQDAWKAADQLEAEHYINSGGSQEGAEILKSFRAIGHNMFDMLYAPMERIIAEAKAKGQPEPTITTKDDTGKTVKINLSVALSMMGDLQGSYFPRKREPGRYVLKAKKDGENPIRKHFDLAVRYEGDNWRSKIPLPINIEAERLRKKGYNVTLEESDALPESVFVELAGQQMAVEAILNKTIENLSEDYTKTLNDIGIRSKWIEDVNVATGEKTRTFSIYGDNTDINKYLEVLREFGGQYRYVSKKKSGYPVINFYNATPDIEAKVTSNILNYHAIDANADAIFAGTLATELADIFKARGARSSMISRGEQTGKDVWKGYEEDAITAFTKSAMGIAGSTAKGKMAKALIDIQTGREISWADYRDSEPNAKFSDWLNMVKENRIDPGKQPKAYQELVSYTKDMLRNDEQIDRVIGTLHGITALKYLAFKVSSAAVNLTSLATSFPATLNGMAKIPLTRVPALLTKSLNRYREYKFGNPNNLDKWTLEAFEHIEREGWDQQQFNHEAMSALQSKLGAKYNKLMEYGMIGFKVTEMMNRVSTIMAAYQGIREKSDGEWTKSKHEDALNKANEISDRAHGDYSKGNQPAFTRGGGVAGNLAKMAYIFKMYQHNYLLNMKKLGMDKEYKALAYMAVSPAILAGAGASVLTPIISAIAGAFGIGGDDPEEEFYKWIEREMGGTASAYARTGAIGLGGYGPSLGGAMDINILQYPKNFYELLGAPGGVAKDLIDGFHSMKQGDWSKAGEKALPVAASNVFRAIRESTEGFTTAKNTPVFYGREPLKLDAVEAAMRSLGFNPARTAMIRDKQYGEKKASAAMQEQLNSIYSKAKKVFMSPASDRSEKDIANIMEMMTQYNDAIKLDPTLSKTRTPLNWKRLMRGVNRSLKPNKTEMSREIDDNYLQ